MRFKGIFLVMAAGVLAGGCETTSPAQQRVADETRCKSYGFRRGADAFSRCLLDIDLDRSADQRSRRSDLMLYSGPRFYGWGPYGRYW